VKEGKEMGEAYSEDLRQRILRAVGKGLPVRQVSGLYEVSTSFIYKALFGGVRRVKQVPVLVGDGE